MAFHSEKAVLALCLRDPVVVDEAISVGLKRDHFTFPLYRLLWSAFDEDRKRGIGPDRATVTGSKIESGTRSPLKTGLSSTESLMR